MTLSMHMCLCRWRDTFIIYPAEVRVLASIIALSDGVTPVVFAANGVHQLSGHPA